MNPILFPEVDPLPVPAPLWIFKVLLYVTFALHISLVQLLIGWSAFAAISVVSKGKLREAYNSIAPHLPNVIAFVVNLGVPPLLFAQVLYGRALYTSSILIGMFWFGVIIVLIFAYFFAYRTSQAPDNWKLKPWLQWITFLSFIYIAWTYVNNLTLMVRPQVWQEMYANTPTGWNTNMSDPTFWSRLAFFLSGGFVFGGLGMIWLYRASKPGNVSDLLMKIGPVLVIIGVPLQLFFGFTTLQKQFEIVANIGANPLYTIGIFLYPIVAMGTLVLAIIELVAPKLKLYHFVYILLAPVYSIGYILVRDVMRDQMLLKNNFNVWDRNIVPNWTVLLIFVVLFLIGVITLYWLLLVLMKKPKEAKNG